MKTSVIFLTGMLIAAVAVGQSQTTKEGNVTPPRFMGDYPNTFETYLQKNISYPDPEKGIQGTVVVSFVVSADGKLKDFQVVNKVYPKYEKEVIHTIKRTNGRWQPATVNGQPVDMRREAIVAFKLLPGIDFEEKARIYADKANHALYTKNNPRKALKLYNHAITFHPYDQSLMEMRANCKDKMGDLAGATDDRDRSQILASMVETDIPLITNINVAERSKSYVENTPEKSMGK